MDNLTQQQKNWIGIGTAITVAVILVIWLIFYLSNLTSVRAGHEAVQVDRPFIFGDSGVNSQVLKTGRNFVWPSTDTEEYNLKPFDKTETFVDITASDNVAIDFTVSMVFQHIAGQTPLLHEKFGKDWYKQKVQRPADNMIRNEARTKSSIDLRTKEKEIIDSQGAILEKIQEYLKGEGIPVLLTQVVIGKVIPPDPVLKEAARTAAEKQREQTQVARAAAELSRKQAETNKAIADSAYANKMKMNPDQYMQRLLLDILEKAEDGDKVNFNVYMMGGKEPQPVFEVGK